MEGKRSSRVLAVSRRYESNRMEDEVWAIAYEQVWPILRKRLDHAGRVDVKGTVAQRAVNGLARSA
jgi:hypothetical protein